jgi:hypothetical protein
MWPFAEKSIVVSLSKEVRLSLSTDRGVSDASANSYRMIEEKGQYASRPVKYFRVYDPSNAKWADVVLHKFSDLDSRRILHSGHTEKDGRIVLNREVSDN